MQFISTKFHALFDYVFAIALISTPWIFYEWEYSPSVLVLVLGGLWLIFYSLLTHYEYGILKIVPMDFHLTLDMLLALMLIVSPWIFDFYHQMFVPHLCFGVLKIVIIIFSSPKRIHHLYMHHSDKFLKN